jgi:hypothetical protein
MAQPGTRREPGRGSRPILILWLAVAALGCSRAEPPPPPPPPAGPSAGLVRVETQPAGLELVADGAVRCRTPCSFRIDPGLHQLTIHKSGYMPWQERVEVPPGGEVTVSAALVSSH